MRIEKDIAGQLEIPGDALYGIHAVRASINFPDRSPFPIEWYKALGLVKQACYIAALSFNDAARKRFGENALPLRLPDSKVLKLLEETAGEVAAGKYFDNFIVPGISGGAGTSINMNVNEIIANASLLKMGFKPGDYHIIDPVEHANIYQSTNDVIPTSLKLATLKLLTGLESSINNLRTEVESLETKYRNVLRIAFTQMQEAVPSSFGKLFSSYSEAFSRDWWRVSKCFERIKIVNLGGSAIGTGLAVPRFFIMEVVPVLQRLSGFPVTRGENLIDTTSNLDSFVEVHAIMKSLAVNLEKMVSDMRLLASDISGEPLIKLPARQTGSSIMPGKINPVIPEFVISSARRVYSNDSVITGLCSQGCLELNAYLPIIGYSLIESLRLLLGMTATTTDNLLRGLEIKADLAEKKLLKSPAITTALVPYIGYHKATELAMHMKNNDVDIYKSNLALKLIDEEILRELLLPDKLLQTGYSLHDLMK